MRQRPGSACCVALNITVLAGRYLTSVQLEGTLRQWCVLQSEREVTEWAKAILCTTGCALHIHLRAGNTEPKQVALELARKLSCQDVVIGISEQRTICRMQDTCLQ